MWIVRVALDRPYTFIVLALMILILSVVAIARTPTDIFPSIASSAPILQLGLSGKGLSEQQLNDLGQNFLRTQLVTVPGPVVPYPHGGKQRQVMINLVPQTRHIICRRG